jgi:hypothetical protein
MLYEKSKDLSKLFIETIKWEAMKQLQTEKNLSAINSTLKLIKKAIDISLAYLEEEKQNFDQIYQLIIDIYLVEDKLTEANSINEKIEDKWLKGEIHKKIIKKEAEKSAIVLKKIEVSFKETQLKEMYSIIKSRAKEAYNVKEGELIKRKAVRKAYFDKALDYLAVEKWDAAIEEYKDSLDRLLRKKDYYLAGLSLVIIYMILIKQNKSHSFHELLKTTKDKLASLEKFFSEVFPIILINYIKDIEELKDSIKFKEALMFFENLPLFDQEIILLHSLLGKEEYIISKASDKEQKSIQIENGRKNIIHYATKIEKINIVKRQLIKQEYWKLALDDLSNKKFKISLEEYIETIPKLLNEKLYNFAGLNLILATFLNLKLKNLNVTKAYLDEKIKKFNEIYPEFEKSPELKIIKELIDAIEHNNTELFSFGLNILLEKLGLFEPEIRFLEAFLQGVFIKEESEKVPTREELAQKRALKTDTEQISSNLNKQIPDMLREKKDLIRKRDILKKRIYYEVITELNQKNFSKASKLYYELAVSMAKRQDLKTSSLLILLHGLCLIKDQKSVVTLKKNITDFLDSLGLRKKLANDYCINLILFTVDVILYELESFYDKIKSLLVVLPLLDEEVILIDIF